MSKDSRVIYPGHLLKEARKKKRRRYRKLSSELGIPEKYLIALEEDNYSSMAGPTYVKGYLRAYSKKLDLDPEIILKAYERYLKDQRKETKQEKKEEKLKKSYKLIYLIAIFIVVILTFVIVYKTLSEDNPDTRISSESTNDIFLEKIEEASKEKTVNPVFFEEAVFQDELVFEQENRKQKNILLSEEIEDPSKTIKILNIIKLSFQDDCWVEIMDRNSVLEYKLAKAGNSIEIKGEGPFKIIIGDSRIAQVLFNNEQVDLLSTTNPNTNVSCLVLPTGKCSEFTLSN